MPKVVKKENKQDRLITIKVSEDFNKTIESLAESEGRSKSNWIKWTLQNVIERKNKK